MSSGSDLAETALSFSTPLRAAPSVHVVPVGNPVPVGCSGTVENPDASPGHLCIFVGWSANTATPGDIAGTYKAETGQSGASRRGTVLIVHAADSGYVETSGTYAVTAP